MDEIVRNGECGDWRLSDEDFIKSYALPERTPTKLANLHPFPREERLHFDAASHKYCMDGRQVPISVTGLLHKYSSGFNPKAALAAMRSGFAWAEKEAELTSKGLETTDEAFLSRWQKNGEVQSARGTLMHFQCEPGDGHKLASNYRTLVFVPRTLGGGVAARWQTFVHRQVHGQWHRVGGASQSRVPASAADLQEAP